MILENNKACWSTIFFYCNNYFDICLESPYNANELIKRGQIVPKFQAFLNNESAGVRDNSTDMG